MIRYGLMVWCVAATVLGEDVRLADLEAASAMQGWGQLQVDQGVGGKPLSIAGRTFARGFGTHANSEIVYELDGAYTNFTAWVGVAAGASSTATPGNAPPRTSTGSAPNQFCSTSAYNAR